MTCHQGDRLAAAVRCDAIRAMSWSVGQVGGTRDKRRESGERSTERGPAQRSSRAGGGAQSGRGGRTGWSHQQPHQPPQQNPQPTKLPADPPTKPIDQFSKTSQYLDKQARQKREKILNQSLCRGTSPGDFSAKTNLSFNLSGAG